ncbi:MAG: hypothetical protein OEZ19_06680 [Paracoccaceae bacterium]|nr:hypothetical protein [Paracoccaceae bacterium]
MRAGNAVDIAEVVFHPVLTVELIGVMIAKGFKNRYKSAVSVQFLLTVAVVLSLIGSALDHSFLVIHVNVIDEHHQHEAASDPAMDESRACALSHGCHSGDKASLLAFLPIQASVHWVARRALPRLVFGNATAPDLPTPPPRFVV